MCNAPSAISHSRWKSSPNWKHQKPLYGSSEGKRRGTDTESSPAGRCGRTAGRRWKEMRSIEFADYMKRKMNTVNKRLVFIIGGPYGFSQKVYEAAHEKMSLSRMTFPIRWYASFCGTTLQGNEHTKWGAVSSWIIKMLGQPAYNRAQHYAVFYARFDVHL